MTLIKSLLIFYPLIIPVWKTEPFDAKNIERANSLYFMTAPEVEFQIKTFRKIKDPRIRGRMVLDLINSNNPEAVSGMTLLYGEEKNNSVKADIMTALYKMKHIAKCSDTSMLKACLKNDNTIIRGYGSALYLDKTKDAKAILELLQTEKSLFVRNLLWSDLMRFAEQCPEPLLVNLANSTNPLTRAGAVRILALKTPSPDSNDTLKKMAEDKEIVVRAYLAEGVAQRTAGGAQILEKLSKDSAVQVRTSVASAKSAPDRMKMHIALSSDPDPEIRRLSIIALRHYRKPNAVNALLVAMNDNYKPVRTAAEDSLIFIKPSADTLKRIGEEYLNQKPAVYSAVRILGTLNDQRFNAEIEKILNTASDTDLMRRAINALGDLNYKKASASIAKKATCKDPLVREAVGNALGVFNVKNTFDTLIKLSTDKVNIVRLAAIKGMGIIRDPYFVNRLKKIISSVDIGAETRAFGCWSLARINKPSSSVIKRLQKNALDDFIPSAGEPRYDADFARIAACMTLIEFSKKDAAAKQAALKVLETLTTSTEQQKIEQGRSSMELMSSPTLQEYARQAELYMQGKEIKMMPLPTLQPHLTVKKYVKR